MEIKKITEIIFIRPYYMIGYGGRRAGIHTGFRTITLVLYIWSLPNLGHMIPLCKGKNPINFVVIRSKVKVTITINRIVDIRVVSAR